MPGRRRALAPRRRRSGVTTQADGKNPRATPAATPGYVYAAGARQKVFTTKATVWLCPTDAKSADTCRIVDVQVAR